MVNNTNVVEISRYLRKPEASIYNPVRGKPVGLVMVHLDRTTGGLTFGYSLCHKDDAFNRATARALATDAIVTGSVYQVGEKPTKIEANITNPASITAAVNSLPVTLRRTAVQVMTSVLRRFYMPGVDYNHAKKMTVART